MEGKSWIKNQKDFEIIMLDLFHLYTSYICLLIFSCISKLSQYLPICNVPSVVANVDSVWVVDDCDAADCCDVVDSSDTIGTVLVVLTSKRDFRL